MDLRTAFVKTPRQDEWWISIRRFSFKEHSLLVLAFPRQKIQQVSLRESSSRCWKQCKSCLREPSHGRVAPTNCQWWLFPRSLGCSIIHSPSALVVVVVVVVVAVVFTWILADSH